ncbi:MAG: hydroxyacid dehydrogenase [Limnochordia bacterium]
MQRILVTEPIHNAGVELLKQEAEVVFREGRPLDELIRELGAIDGIVVRTARIGAEVMDLLPGLKVIGKHGVGYDNIDVDAATQRGVAVVFTPGANSISVAEHALTLMMNLANKVSLAHLEIREGRLGEQKRYMGNELNGKTLGLIGLGRIGRHLAKCCRLAFDMRVVAYDPYVKESDEVELCSLEEVLSKADFLSIHVPLTPETKDIVAARELAMMKPTAFLINTSRGGVVNEEDLYQALKDGQLAGAGLDVFVKEPPQAANPLVQLDNVIATPHTGAVTEEAMERMAAMAAEEVLAVLAGRVPRNLVNPQVFDKKGE